MVAHSFFVMNFILIMFIALGGQHSNAQADGAGGGIRNEFGIFSGRVLPNGVDGAEDIFTLSGVRYSRAFSSSGHGFWEIGGVFGNSLGVEWKGAFASLRMDIPIETLVGFTYIGGDYTQYTGVGTEEIKKGGGHVGGGIMSNIGGSTHFRFDMKLNSKPGTSLLFALGLSWAF